ncbi:MAG: hypothetical protein Q9160_004862 [Pyrenula sp. 1 TL-2023]
MPPDLAESVAPDRCRLMQIPLEIRKQIFEELLVDDVPLMSTQHTTQSNMWWNDHTTILRCSKAIYNEASKVLYSQNTVVYSLEKPWNALSTMCGLKKFSAVTSLGLSVHITPCNYPLRIDEYFKKLLEWNKIILQYDQIKVLNIYSPSRSSETLSGIFDLIGAVLLLLNLCRSDYTRSPRLGLTLHKLSTGLSEDPIDFVVQHGLGTGIKMQMIEHPLVPFKIDDQFQREFPELSLPTTLQKYEIHIEAPASLCECFHYASGYFSKNGSYFVDVQQDSSEAPPLKREMVWIAGEENASQLARLTQYSHKQIWERIQSSAPTNTLLRITFNHPTSALLQLPANTRKGNKILSNRNKRESRFVTLAKIKKSKMVKPLNIAQQIKMTKKLKESQGREKKRYKLMRQVSEQAKKEEQIARSRFLSLPLEIRTKVYQEILVRDRETNLDTHEIEDWWPDKGELLEPRFPAILRVSRQIYEEPHLVLYQQNNIGIQMHGTALASIGDIGQNRLRHLEVRPSESLISTFKAHCIHNWCTVRDSCAALQRVDFNLWDGEFDEDPYSNLIPYENLFPVLAISIASGSCTKPSPPCILKMRANIDELDYGGHGFACSVSDKGMARVRHSDVVQFKWERKELEKHSKENISLPPGD